MKTLELNKIYNQKEFDEIIDNFESSGDYEIQTIGPFVAGVQTYIIQGGSDENYIFVLSSWVQESFYALIYKY